MVRMLTVSSSAPVLIDVTPDVVSTPIVSSPGDYGPACVEAGPAGAMTFGDLDDRDSEVSRLAESRRAYRLLEDLGTEPKVIYLHEKE